MPRLTLGGHVCAPGMGGGLVSIDGVAVHPNGGDANWLTPTEILFQGCDGGACQLLAYELTTGITHVVDPAGANWLRARDGEWAAWLNGIIRTSAGWIFSGYLADVAEGQVWVTDLSQQNLLIYTIDGDPMGVLPTAPIVQDATAGLNVRVRDGYVLYLDYTGVHLVRLVDMVEIPIALRIEPINYAVPLVIDGEPWLLERSDRLTLRPAAATEGYDLTHELCFGADAICDGPSVYVTWATTQGELPESVRLIVPDLTGPPIDLNDQPHTDAPHTDHADAPHTDHADAPHDDAPHTDHADTPHTDHADTPHTDGPPMTNAIVGARGPGGKFARCDPNDPEHIYFDKDDVGGHERIEMLPRDGKPGVYALRFVEANVVINGSGSWKAGDVETPFHTRPADAIGGHEEFHVSIQPPEDDCITAVVYFTVEGEEETKWTSVPLVLVEQPTG